MPLICYDIIKVLSFLLFLLPSKTNYFLKTEKSLTKCTTESKLNKGFQKALKT